MKNIFPSLTLIFVSLLLVIGPVFAISVDSKEISVQKYECCKLKHDIKIGTKYKAGDWVGSMDAKASEGTCPQDPANQDPNWAGYCMVDAAMSIKDIVMLVAMVASAVALVVAGILFVAATGNPERLKLAKGAFYTGLIGVLVIGLAQFIPAVVRFFIGI